MANSVENLSIENEEEDQSFEELGLDPRLVRALTKKDITRPTPIQHVAVPLILVSLTSFPIIEVFANQSCKDKLP